MSYSAMRATVGRQIASTQQSLLRKTDYGKYVDVKPLYAAQPGLRLQIRSQELQIAYYLDDPNLTVDQCYEQIRSCLREISGICQRGLRSGKLTRKVRTFSLGEIQAKFDLDDPAQVTFTGKLEFPELAPFAQQQLEVIINGDGGLEDVTVESRDNAQPQLRYVYITPEFWSDLAMASQNPQALRLRWATDRKAILAACPQARIRRSITTINDDEYLEYLKVLPAASDNGASAVPTPAVMTGLQRIAQHLATKYNLLLDESPRFPTLVHFVASEQATLLRLSEGACKTKQEVPSTSGLYTLDPGLEQRLCTKRYRDFRLHSCYCVATCQHLYRAIQEAFTIK